MSENDDLAIKRFVSTSKGTIVIGKMSIEELVKLTGEDPKTEKDKERNNHRKLYRERQ